MSRFDKIAKAIGDTAKRILRWRYRDSKSGQFISKDEFDRRDPATTERERM